MRLGVGKIEAAAQRVTELVVKAHLHGAECCAGEPCAIQRVSPGGNVSQ